MVTEPGATFARPDRTSGESMPIFRPGWIPVSKQPELIDHEARPSLGSTCEDPSPSPEALVDERFEPSEQPPQIFAPAATDPGLEPAATFARPLQTLFSSPQRS